MAFTDEELEYLRSQPLARLATVAPDGQPDVTPVALEVESTTLWVCGHLVAHCSALLSDVMRTLSGLCADFAGPQRLAVALGSLQGWRRSGDVHQPVVGLGHHADEGSPRLFSRGKSALNGHGHLLGRQVFISDSQSTQSF